MLFWEYNESHYLRLRSVMVIHSKVRYSTFLCLAQSAPFHLVDGDVERNFRALFGVSTNTCYLIWRKCKFDPALKIKPTHLLWALYFLKTYDTVAVMATRMRVSKRTLSKWIWIVLGVMRERVHRVVSVSSSRAKISKFGH